MVMPAEGPCYSGWRVGLCGCETVWMFGFCGCRSNGHAVAHAVRVGKNKRKQEESRQTNVRKRAVQHQRLPSYLLGDGALGDVHVEVVRVEEGVVRLIWVFLGVLVLRVSSLGFFGWYMGWGLVGGLLDWVVDRLPAG